MERLGRYHLGHEISVTDFASVHRGYLVAPGGVVKPVTIRRVLPAFAAKPDVVDLLLEEARIRGLLEHSQIVAVLDVDQHDGRWFLVEERVFGQDLGSLIRRAKMKGVRLDVHAALYFSAQILDALAHAHSRTDADGNALGIVHRDVCPANVYVGYGGEIKLGGFAYAKLRTRPSPPAPGFLHQRHGYISPEQALGSDVDHRADIYSVGLIAYELLTGLAAYESKTDLEALARAQRGQRRSIEEILPSLSGDVRELIERAMIFDKRSRHASAAMFRDELARILYVRDPTYSADRVVSLMAQVFAEEAAEEREYERAERLELGGWKPSIAPKVAPSSLPKLVPPPPAQPPPPPPISSPENPLLLPELEESQPSWVPAPQSSPSMARGPGSQLQSPSSSGARGPGPQLQAPPSPGAQRGPGSQSSPGSPLSQRGPGSQVQPSQSSPSLARGPGSQVQPSKSSPGSQPSPPRGPGSAVQPSQSSPSLARGPGSQLQPAPASLAPGSSNPQLEPSQFLPEPSSPESFASSAVSSTTSPAIAALAASATSAKPPPTSVLEQITAPGLGLAPKPISLAQIALAASAPAAGAADLAPVHTHAEKKSPILKIAVATVLLLIAGVTAFAFSSDKNNRLVSRKLRAVFIGRQPGGTLTIESVPPGAKIQLDDEDTGRRTPLVVDNLESGVIHDLLLTLDDGDVVSSTVTVKAGAKSTVSILFPNAVVPLVVNSDPPGAEVWIDNRMIALAPASLVAHVGKETTVRLTRAGYVDTIRKVTAERGKAIALAIVMEKTKELQEAEAAEAEAIKAAEEEAAAEEKKQRR